jgi:hypothetical protein
MSRNAVGSFIVLLLLSTLSACGGSAQQTQSDSNKKQTKVVLIWCDVTSSLRDLESEEVANLASSVLDHLPEDARYVVYPIQNETGRPVHIIKKGPSLDATSVSEAETEDTLNVDRATYIKKEISRLYQENKKKHPHDRRTCILNTLEVSAKYFSQFDDKYDPELVFISDMLEDCQYTPLHRNVQLDQQPFSETIKMIDSFASPPDLSRPRITIIVPTAKDTATVPSGQRPAPLDVERFWTTVFARCNFSKDLLANKDRYFWSPEGVPERLLRLAEE